MIDSKKLNTTAELERWIDCGQDGPCAKSPGCNRHWEERNRELVQHVAWLEGFVESKEKLQAWLEKTLTEANSRITNLTIDFLSQLEAKDKRVAELEEIAVGRAQLIDDQRETIESIQSQLAWTPVSAGLPTEPGLYLFTCRGDEKLYTITEGKFLEHTDNGTDPWDASAMRYWTHYRRIELPKDGESRGCDCDTPTTVHDVACPMKGGES